MDPNFSTVDQNTVNSNILTGVSGVSAGPVGSRLGVLLTTNEDVEGYSLSPVQSLVAKKGDTSMYCHHDGGVPGTNTYITTSCKDPAAAACFLNYGYTEEGNMLYNFGIEGVSYEMKDDEPVYTDLIMNNPDGLNMSQAMSEYFLSWYGGPFVQRKEYILQYYAWDEQKLALENSVKTDVTKYKLPNTVVGEEYMDEYSNLKSELETYRDETELKFIRGEESLDKFDEYLNMLKKMGIDRLLEIEQMALEEYNTK